jgi:DNA end-binding protein Ku
MIARRAIWRGEITFADIRVPVKLYPAVQEQELALHFLHDQDNTRLQQQLFCELENKAVDREEVVKG